MLTNTVSTEMHAAIAKLDIPDVEKLQIRTAITLIMGSYEDFNIAMVPGLIALAYATGCYLSLIPGERRERLRDRLTTLQATASRIGELLNPANFPAGEFADTSSGVLALKQKLGEALIGLPYPVVVPALVELIASVVMEIRPHDLREQLGKMTVKILREMLREPVEDIPVH